MNVRSLKQLAGVAACISFQVSAVAQITPSPESGASVQLSVARPFPHGITLASLGRREGIVFSGLIGRQSLFFRIPAEGTAVRLVLPYEASTAAPVPRSVAVLSGERVLGRFSIDGRGTIDVPIPADAIVAGTLPITLVYAGASSANLCFDRRASQDRLRFLPIGGLGVDIAPGSPLSVAATAALAGPAPAIGLPGNLDANQAAAALTVVAARGGGTLTTGAPAVDHVSIAGKGDPALAGGWRGNASVLTIGGRDPAAAARAVFSSYTGLLDAPRIDRLSVRPQASERLAFADLGADMSAQQADGSGAWSMALPASRLPAGKTVGAVAVDLAAVPGDPGDRASLWFNTVLLGSAPLAASGRTHLRAEVPAGLVHSLNGITVRIDRRRAPNCGEMPEPLPAQLLPSSTVILRGAGPVRDFHDFARAGHAGVTAVLPGPGALPLAAKVVAGLFDASVPIAVSWRAIPADGPVLLIADRPPGDATPPLATGNGRMRLDTANGEVTLDLPDRRDVTLAQMFEQGGRPMLWIRPAAGVVPASMWLDDGDVAIVEGNGRIAAVSSTRPDLSVVPPSSDAEPSFWQQNQRLLLIILGALAGIAIVAWALRPSHRKPRLGEER